MAGSGKKGGVMYEDILEKVIFDDKDLVEQFIKGVIENMKKMNDRLHHIENDISDIKEMIK